MEKKEEISTDQSSEEKEKQVEEKDLSSLSDVEKFKEASTEDQEAFLKQAAEGTFDAEDQDEETSKESDEDSEAEEKKDEPSDEEQSSDDKDSQSDDSSEDEKDNENSTDFEKRFSKLEKSYKSLEAEFTRRSQKLGRQDDELDRRDSRIRELESELKRQKGQADKSSILDKVKEKNPDAANLLSMLKEEAVSEAKEQFEKELASLKSQFGERKVEENRATFQSSLDEFMKSPLAALEPELLEIINSNYGSEDELVKAAGTDPELFVKLRKELLSKHFEKAAKVTGNKSKSKPVDKARDKEIQNAKGAGKSKTSGKKDVDDPDSLDYFNTLSEKQQVAYLKKRGLYK